MSLISAIIALGLLIFIHELGHFLVAKWAGVGVSTFSLGFGTRLIGFKYGETDYRISLIPLGGFVRMVGENPGDEVAPEDEARSFAHKSLGWRAAIVAAGPISNVVLALAFYLFVLLAWGIPTLTTKAGDVMPDSPAMAAGIQKDDVILAMDGKPVADWGELVAAIQLSEGKSVPVMVERQGRELELSLAPRLETVTDIFGDEHKIYRVGIKASPETFTRHVGMVRAVELALDKTYWSAEIIIKSVVKLIQRKVSMDSVGGPILIAQAASEAASQGLAPLMELTALISVNLAVINLLPIPALDGGHLLFFLIEAIRRRPVSLHFRERAQQAGMALLLLLMVFIFYNDIARIVSSGM